MLLDIDKTLHGNFDNSAVRTHKGMAHFAATWPVGSTCGGCKYWKKIGEKARANVCEKARSLGTKCSMAIPADAAACKYFAAAYA